MSELAPLRRIVRVIEGEWITREILECGHTNDAHGAFAQRRRCRSCLRGIPAMRCPDEGRCYHRCAFSCFRVTHFGPLSGVYPGDEWPDDVVAAATAAADLQTSAPAGAIRPGAPTAHTGGDQ